MIELCCDIVAVNRHDKYNMTTLIYNNRGGANMSKYICNVCGYEYDGDVPFEELPDDYTCPLCGVDKSNFDKED